MKKNLITDVIQGMLPYLNNAQTERLQATSPSLRIFIYAALPFSRHGVIRAIKVSPFIKRTPPLYGLVISPVGMQPLVGNVDISKQRASTPLERGREGLTSAISANVQSVSSQEKNKLSKYA